MQRSERLLSGFVMLWLSRVRS